MGNIRARTDNEKLFFDFRYQGVRCREQTALDDTASNRKKLEQMMERIDAEILLGQFDYRNYFPNSSKASQFQSPQDQQLRHGDTPLFREFAETWVKEMEVQWRPTHTDGVQRSLRKYILPAFAEKEVGHVTKSEILEFRSTLAKVTKRNGDHLSATRINHIITPLRMILNEAANRFEFTSPYHGIKSLKVEKTHVEPFTLEEVQQIINTVRSDFKNYYIVRFFTGMRTSEIDGLQWEYVDFERRQLVVKQALVQGELVRTKNDGSFRSIDMSQWVYEALMAQREATGNNSFVFCNTEGNALNHNNVCKRVWHPLLSYLGFRKRRPYQTRHTAATLWLAAGESPEWIARQMGHSTTEMLFRVYSRFVPNLTRQDGSAFERLLQQHMGGAS